VLIVTTKRGDFVLDNLTDETRPLGRQSATIISVQSARDPRLWQRVRH
jgi:predicted transglutaminase-like cysteine proteinase